MWDHLVNAEQCEASAKLWTKAIDKGHNGLYGLLIAAKMYDVE